MYPIYNSVLCVPCFIIYAFNGKMVVIFDDFLSLGDCARVIRLASDRLQPSEVVLEETGERQRHPDRVSDDMNFRKGETVFIRSLELRIAGLAGVGVENMEALHVVRYRPGGFYKPHYDFFNLEHGGYASLISRGGQRVATVIIYLNSPRAGGETVFPNLQLTVPAVTGKAVLFNYPNVDTYSLHGGNPVLAGEKWILTAWIRTGTFI